jgi:hypothetical protein
MSPRVLQEAWRLLDQAVITYAGKPVGTAAARDAQTSTLNYDQIFTRDFAVSAFAFLLDGRGEIVRHFLTTAVQLQSQALLPRPDRSGLAHPDRLRPEEPPLVLSQRR